jgi:hypothetical protein
MPTAINWTPELMGLVLARISDGSTLRETAEEFEISPAAILRQCVANEVFAKQYACALQIRGDADFEGLQDQLNAEPERGKYGIDPGWANWQRTRIDTLKWMISKRNPKKYGERVQQEISGELAIKRVIVDV